MPFRWRINRTNYVGMPGMHGTVRENLRLHNICIIYCGLDHVLEWRSSHFVAMLQTTIHCRKVISIDVDLLLFLKRIKLDC